MTTAIAKSTGATSLEKALINGDLATLSPEDRLLYYRQTCESLGLNPLTKPFDYIKLNGKLTLYARKDATDQLRKLRGVSIDKPDIQQIDNLIIVTVMAVDKDGRKDSDIGVVGKGDMGGNIGNALMKAVTKAKRRVTLSICGLGILDETEVEVESIPNAVPIDAEPVTDEPQPTKAQLMDKAPAHLAEQRARVQSLCKELNAAKDSIKWTGATLTEYVNDLFSVDDGLNAMTGDSFVTLIADLEYRLAQLAETEG